MNTLLYIREIWRGKDLYRILMNTECLNYALKGKIADIGSGPNKASYHRFVKKQPGAEISALDCATSRIDFEHDRLPYPDAGIDAVMAFNVLEHIFNYSSLLSEIRRVLKPGGRVYGATPFLVGYHPDPKDFWRYTGSALQNIFESNGFKEIQIKILGRGPFIAGYSQIEFLFPRPVKLAVLPGLFLLDWIFYKIRPKTNRQKFALGLFFMLTKG